MCTYSSFLVQYFLLYSKSRSYCTSVFDFIHTKVKSHFPVVRHIHGNFCNIIYTYRMHFNQLYMHFIAFWKRNTMKAKSYMLWNITLSEPQWMASFQFYILWFCACFEHLKWLCMCHKKSKGNGHRLPAVTLQNILGQIFRLWNSSVLEEIINQIMCVIYWIVSQQFDGLDLIDVSNFLFTVG